MKWSCYRHQQHNKRVINNHFNVKKKSWKFCSQIIYSSFNSLFHNQPLLNLIEYKNYCYAVLFFLRFFFLSGCLFHGRSHSKDSIGKGEPIVFFGITSTRSRTFRHLIAFLSLKFIFNYQPISRRDQYPKFKFINLIF